ncbi:MAG: NnrU family protein [Betaproteobacteria bacterium]|nr:NnrU family protein [Betaproteobacteria bacterium]
MAVMIVGLVLFIGIHLVPEAPRLRARLIARFGDRPYRGLFAAVSAMGLVLIIAGYHLRPERVPLFAPFPPAREAAPLLVTLAFVLFAVANMRSHIRRIVRHPMLVGLMLWSGVHLLANGDLAGTLLFGSFFAYSVVALVSAIRRGAMKPFVPEWKYDVMAVAGALVLAWLTILAHAWIFGTGPVAWT